MKKETAHEKETRIFEHYKKRLETESAKDRKTRMNVIEYLCSFPKIDPIKMAAEIISDGYNVAFDDSSITKKENERKRKAVEKLIK